MTTNFDSQHPMAHGIHGTRGIGKPKLIQQTLAAGHTLRAVRTVTTTNATPGTAEPQLGAKPTSQP